MAFCCLLFIGAVVLLLCRLCRKQKSHLRSPPGPKGLPFVGSMMSVGDGNMGEVFFNWRKNYGPIMSVRMGNEAWVVLNNYDVIHKALVKQGTKFSSRPKNFHLMNDITEGLGVGFTPYGPHWKAQRKFGIMTLRGLGVGKKSMEENVIAELDYLTEELKKQKEAFDSKTTISKAVSNVTCNVVMGKRFDYDDESFNHLIKLFNQAFSSEDSVYMNFIVLAFWMRHLPKFRAAYKKFKKEIKYLLDTFEGIVKEHEKTFDENNLRDFIDAFIKEMNHKTDPSYHPRQLLQYVRDLFEGGTETTSSTLQWCFLSLLHWPQYQDKIYEEIKEEIGENYPSMKHQSKMPFTMAFIQEIMRHRTLLGTSIWHATSEDAELDGYFIPNNTTVIANIWAVHNDPDVFENPNEFRPERFINDDGEFVKSPNVIPFSVGPRHCLGQQLANMQLFVFLVRIIQLFRIAPDKTGQFPDFNDGQNGFSYTPKPYRVKFEPREDYEHLPLSKKSS